MGDEAQGFRRQWPQFMEQCNSGRKDWTLQRDGRWGRHKRGRYEVLQGLIGRQDQVPEECKRGLSLKVCKMLHLIRSIVSPLFLVLSREQQFLDCELHSLQFPGSCLTRQKPFHADNSANKTRFIKSGTSYHSSQEGISRVEDAKIWSKLILLSTTLGEKIEQQVTTRERVETQSSTGQDSNPVQLSQTENRQKGMTGN